MPRIYELGGKLPRSMIDFHNVSACLPAFVPADPTNIKDMLQILVDAERCAVRGYSEICNHDVRQRSPHLRSLVGDSA